MSNGILNGREKQLRFTIDSRVTEDEGQLNRLIIAAKEERIELKEVNSFLESIVTTNPHAIPVLCSMVAAQFPNNEFLTEEYLHDLIIKSYEQRINRGEKRAKELLDLFLKRSGRKEDFTTLNNSQPEEA